MFSPYLEASPLLIGLWLLATPVLAAWRRRKTERARIVEPYWGEAIPGRDDPVL